jgi:adenine/guanine phosphoribosyltransferase-like PRPP-binding protein
MKVAIVGSRNLSPNIEPYLPGETTAIVTGGAKGVDQAAMDLADRLGLELIVFRPDYKRYGRGAPIVRNKQIVQESDLVLAFWDGQSRGTKNAISLAQKLDKPFRIVRIDDELQLKHLKYDS